MEDQRGCRAQRRFDIRIPVELSFQGRTLSTFTRNISLGGMFLQAEEQIPFGALVQLTFSLPEMANKVVVDAHVRWVQGDGGLGVQFSGLRAREVWALQKLFEKPPCM